MKETHAKLRETTLPHHEPPAHPQMRYTRVFLKSAGIGHLSERLYHCALKSLHTTPSHRASWTLYDLFAAGQLWDKAMMIPSVEKLAKH